MDFELNPEQRLIRDSARDFLREAFPVEAARAAAAADGVIPDRVWRGMAALGWQGWPFPTEHGGGGGTFLELTILLEEMGRALVPGPFFASVVLGGQAILAAASPEQAKRLLPGIASGDRVVTLALTEPGARHEAEVLALRAVPVEGGHELHGTKILVPYASLADQIVCVAGADDGGSLDAGDGVSLFLVDRGAAGLTIIRQGTLGQDGQCEVRFDGVPVGSGDVLGSLGNGRPILQRVLQLATIARCAEMVGGAGGVLEMTLDYARTRIQFRRPIGSLQSIQHRCADVVINLEVARALTADAAWKVDQGLPFGVEASMAKARANDAYREATWLAALVQGGAGFLDEHNLLPLHYRRAKAAELALGDSDHHLEAIARALLDAPLNAPLNPVHPSPPS